MDQKVLKKIDLLLHLAKVDGKYDKSERNLLHDLLKSYGLDENYADTHESVAVSFAGFADMEGKEELVLRMLKLIMADDFIHEDEVTFAKAVATKLGFDSDLIDYYTESALPELTEFEKDVQRFKL